MKREKRLSLAGQQGPAGQGIAILYSFSKYCMLGPVLSALPVLSHRFSPATQQQGDHNIFSFYMWETAAQRAYKTYPRLLSTGTQGPYCAKVVLTTIFSHFGASWRVRHWTIVEFPLHGLHSSTYIVLNSSASSFLPLCKWIQWAQIFSTFNTGTAQAPTNGMAAHCSLGRCGLICR